MQVFDVMMANKLSETDESEKITPNYVKDIEESNSMELSKSNTQIIDLTIDCLEEIFEYLDLHDLLNVADSNKRLNKAAGLVFSRKHGNKYVLNRERPSYWGFPEKDGEYLGITDNCSSLRLVRCFGHSISGISIDCFMCNQEFYTELFRYVNKYCTQSLVKLHVRGYRHNIFDDIQKPFEKVEKVLFEYCTVNVDQTMFNEVFPQMRHLTFFSNKIEDSRCIGACFSKLEHFKYSPNVNHNYNPIEHHKLFVRLNPQLKTVALHGHFGQTFIRKMSEHLYQLEELRIGSLYASILSNPVIDMSQVHFKSVKKYEIDMTNDRRMFSMFAPSFDQLADFTVDGITPDDLLDFVKKNPKIIKLKIRDSTMCFNLNDENLLKIAKALSSLSDIDVSEANWNGYSIHGVTRVMVELKQLKMFKFMLNQSYAVRLRNKFSDEWNYVKIESRFGVCIVTLEGRKNALT